MNGEENQKAIPRIDFTNILDQPADQHPVYL